MRRELNSKLVLILIFLDIFFYWICRAERRRYSRVLILIFLDIFFYQETMSIQDVAGEVLILIFLDIFFYNLVKSRAFAPIFVLILIFLDIFFYEGEDLPSTLSEDGLNPYFLGYLFLPAILSPFLHFFNILYHFQVHKHCILYHFPSAWR
mgnify:CR=1 FL=1